MNDAGKEGICNLFRQFLIIDQTAQDFRTGARLRVDHVDIREPGIADMMVNADSFCCCMEEICRDTDPVHRTRIAGNEKILPLRFRNLRYDLLHPLKEHELIRWTFQIQRHIDLRTVFSDILIYRRHRPDTVSVRIYMSGDCAGPDPFGDQFTQFLHFQHSFRRPHRSDGTFPLRARWTGPQGT